MPVSCIFSPNDAEGVLEAFERAWQAGAPWSIEDCLKASPIPGSKLLTYLVHMDLEYRLKGRQQARIEDYLGRFPQLTDGTAKLIELLETECRHRIEFGQPPTHNEYLDRFPHLREHLCGTSLDGACMEVTGRADCLPPSWLPETVGRHRVLRPIKEGGMGEIIRLQDEDFHRPLAMKVLKSGLHGDQNARKRFLLEARLTGHLQHPGIPPVLEMGELPDGRPYFIMKLIEGESLKDLLGTRQLANDKHMDLIGIFDQVCRTVAYAHACGIIHRDLKPDNIMVGKFGEVQVMDWGLAKDLDASFDSTATEEPDDDHATGASGAQSTLNQGKTTVGTELGTPAYMAPEQAHGRIEQMNRRSDVFCLGGILCEILTGKPPFENSRQSRNCDLSGAFARLNACDTDPELIALAKRCLAADTKDRPDDADAVARAMGEYHELVRERLRQAEVARGQAEIRALEEGKRVVVERQKRRATLALAGVVIVAVLAGAGGGWWALEQQAKQGREAEVRQKATHAANLLMDADEKEFAVLFPKLEQYGEQGLRLLRDEIERELPADLPSSDERRETLGKRKANAAVALLRMNEPEKVWPLLKRKQVPDDPRVRSYLIHRLAPLGANALAIIERLRTEPEITIRRALILSLGEFGHEALPAAARGRLLPDLKEMYRKESDPGLHAALEWLLRTWNEKTWLEQVKDEWARNTQQRIERLQGIKKLLADRNFKAPMQWYPTSQGQTMVVVTGPVELTMGSHPTEKDRNYDEPQHKRLIRRTFALSSTAVTVHQFSQFMRADFLPEVPDLPMTTVDYDMAARYCNWLSQQEELDECYESKEDHLQPKPGYLKLSGYRLPTEAEMEYATRAGAITSRFFGETEELLAKYGWIDTNSQNRSWPVGTLKPNDLGFFDVHGNVRTWCLESYGIYRGDLTRDSENWLVASFALPRVARGGSFLDRPAEVRSAVRHKVAPTERWHSIGFRLARTIRP